YGLGGILYHLLTGRPPHSGATHADLLEGARRGQVTLPRQLNAKVPAALERICLKALAAAPEQRHPSAAALAADLPRHLTRPRRLAQVAAIAGALLALGVAAWLIAAGSRGTSPAGAGTPVPSGEPSAAALTGWVDVRVWDGARTRNERALAAGTASA